MSASKLYKQRSSCNVVVFSHNSKDGIDISNSVLACNTKKHISMMGEANIVLRPTENFLNKLFPDDVVVVYFSNGESGNWQVFFGYVNNVRRTVSIDQEGKPLVRFLVNCSDFQKVFERTEIYFNPHVANRSKDFAQQIGGAALRTMGISVYGSPADLVLSGLELLLGFGAQWVLPKSLPLTVGQSQTRDFREFSAPFKQKEINNDLKNKIVSSTGANLSQDTITKIQTLQLGQSDKTVLDLIETNYIEKDAVDGFYLSDTIWQYQGSLIDFLRAVSNQPVNELFFDLREAYEPGVSGGSDITGLNLKGAKPTPVLVPSVILRECPFSTINALNGNGIKVDGETIGLLFFGNVFFKKDPVFEVPVLKFGYESNNASDFYTKNCQRVFEHSDLEVTEIIEEDIGRSDGDHFNLFECYSEDLLGVYWRYMLQDFLPIITPINIKKHGLRVKTVSTKFARVDGGGPNEKSNVQENPIDNFKIRRRLIRWALLLDHWYQHNLEYLSGTMKIRGRPDIRVGKRLDIIGRDESYYIEGVDHQWSFPNMLTTQLVLTRGQPNGAGKTLQYKLPAHFGSGVIYTDDNFEYLNPMDNLHLENPSGSRDDLGDYFEVSQNEQEKRSKNL